MCCGDGARSRWRISILWKSLLDVACGDISKSFDKIGAVMMLPSLLSQFGAIPKRVPSKLGLIPVVEAEKAHTKSFAAPDSVNLVPTVETLNDPTSNTKRLGNI